MRIIQQPYPPETAKRRGRHRRRGGGGPQRLFVRLEANLGLVRSPVRRESVTAIDAPGAGLWLTYQLK